MSMTSMSREEQTIWYVAGGRPIDEAVRWFASWLEALVCQKRDWGVPETAIQLRVTRYCDVFEELMTELPG